MLKTYWIKCSTVCFGLVNGWLTSFSSSERNHTSTQNVSNSSILQIMFNGNVFRIIYFNNMYLSNCQNQTTCKQISLYILIHQVMTENTVTDSSSKFQPSVLYCTDTLKRLMYTCSPEVGLLVPTVLHQPDRYQGADDERLALDPLQLSILCGGGWGLIDISPAHQLEGYHRKWTQASII